MRREVDYYKSVGIESETENVRFESAKNAYESQIRQLKEIIKNNKDELDKLYSLIKKRKDDNDELNKTLNDLKH